MVVSSESLTAAEHLNIYRGSMLGIHTQALGDIFPVCRKLVGQTFFDAMARAYIPDHPGKTANLNDYGDTFSHFIRLFAPAQSVPYLADVASLEWFNHRAFHAQNAMPFDLEAFSLTPETEQSKLRFQLSPGSQLLQSPYPINRIWEANQSNDDATISIDFDAPPVHLLVWRNGYQVEIQTLEKSLWLFLNDLSNGLRLEKLVDKHPVGHLQFVISQGWVNSFYV